MERKIDALIGRNFPLFILFVFVGFIALCFLIGIMADRFDRDSQIDKDIDDIVK